MRFEGTDTYVAPRDLTVAVNAAIALQRPLLVKGEPGTGKTVLAEEIARAICFMASPAASWCNGSHLVVDGAYTNRTHF